MNDAASRSILSGARLDVTTVALLAEAGPLARSLPSPELRLAPLAGVPAGRHVVILDVFRVSEGRIHVAGLPQDELLATSGTAMGAGTGSMIGGGFGSAYGAMAGATLGGSVGLRYGPAAWWLAAAAGWMMGGAVGGAAGTLAGARRGSAVGGELARRSARELSRTLGSYGEVIVAIPNVVFREQPKRPFLYVLRMYTDSALARWGDQRLGFGYGKRMATVAAHPFRSVSVRSRAAPLLTAAFAPVRDDDWRPSAAPGPPLEARAWLAQPMLGRLPDGRLASSRLHRTYDGPGGAYAFPARTRLSLARGVVPGVAGTHRLEAASDARPWGVWHARAVMSRLTYPRARPARDQRGQA